jgi:O-antigen ligase
MAGIIYIFGGETYKQEMSTITDTKESTARERILSWQASWRMFLDNPLGVGAGNFPVRFPQYQPEELQRGMWGRVSHSLWFTLLPELGIIGTFIYFSIIFQNLRDISLIRKFNITKKDLNQKFYINLSTALYTSLAGFFASATFLSVLYYPHFWYFTAFISAVSKISITINENVH